MKIETRFKRLCLDFRDRAIQYIDHQHLPTQGRNDTDRQTTDKKLEAPSSWFLPTVNWFMQSYQTQRRSMTEIIRQKMTIDVV